MEPDWIDTLAAALVAAMPDIQRDAGQVAQNEQRPGAGGDMARERSATVFLAMTEQDHAGKWRLARAEKSANR